MTITIKKMPGVAPRGNQQGKFVALNPSASAVPGKEENTLTGVFELDAEDTEGKPFRIEKKYNLLGRGVKSFQNDYHAITGGILTPELLDSFDETLLLKKPTIATIDYRKDGKDLIPVIKNFVRVTNEQPAMA